MNIHLLEGLTQPKRPGNTPTILRQRHSSFKTLGRTNTQLTQLTSTRQSFVLSLYVSCCLTSVVLGSTEQTSTNVTAQCKFQQNSASDKVLSHITSKRDVHCRLSVHVTCTARLICHFHSMSTFLHSGGWQAANASLVVPSQATNPTKPLFVLTFELALELALLTLPSSPGLTSELWTLTSDRSIIQCELVATDALMHVNHVMVVL